MFLLVFFVRRDSTAVSLMGLELQHFHTALQEFHFLPRVGQLLLQMAETLCEQFQGQLARCIAV